ncbi:hypothetical protein NL676_004075 [Syzygium grande]|nr:hypothetical protein NL676_004075 [Syzygium grande]
MKEADYCDGSGSCKECHLKNRCLYHLKYGDVASSHGNLVVETAESDVAYTMSVSSAGNMLDVPAGTSKKTPSGLDGGLADSATPFASLVQKAREALESQVKAIKGWQPLCEGMARLLWDLYLTPSHGLTILPSPIVSLQHWHTTPCWVRFCTIEVKLECPTIAN